MRRIVKHYFGFFIILLSIMVCSTVSFAAELSINNDHVIYTNKEHNFSATLPKEGYVFFDKKIFCDGEELDASEYDLHALFEEMTALGGLFIYSDYDFTYEISCSVMPLSVDYDWDKICAEIENGKVDTSEMLSALNADDIKEKYGDYINDAEDSILNDYLDNANTSLEKINGYNYLVINYHESENSPYIIQYMTAIGNEQYFFKYQQYSGTPSKESLDTFHQIINSSNLPPKPVKVSSNDSSVSKTNAKLTDNIFIRLASFLIVIAIIYGLRSLNSGRHKKEGPVSWNPDIDYSETPFADSLTLREHILKDSYNLSFLWRKEALILAESKKPYLSLGFALMWILAVILPLAESIFTQNWWILISIPVGLLIPTYSRRIKNWMQIIPIAIGTIFSNPIIFYICINFVIIRSLYDLWYSSVLKTAGEVVCTNDELFSQAWKDSALAVLVDGEPYFHGKLTQSGIELNQTHNQDSRNMQKDQEPLADPEPVTEDKNLAETTIQFNTPNAPAEEDTISSVDCINEPAIITAPTIKFCNKCGQKLEAGYRFCLKCGNEIQRSNTAAGDQIPENNAEQQNTVSSAPKTNKTKHLSDEDIQQIKYWKQLLDDGIITEDEFQNKKKDILGD